MGGETDEVLRVAVGGGPMENRILISLTGERKKERRLEWSKVGRGCSHLTTSAFCPTTQVTPYTVGRDVILTTRRGFSFYSEILHRRRYPGSRVWRRGSFRSVHHSYSLRPTLIVLSPTVLDVPSLEDTVQMFPSSTTEARWHRVALTLLLHRSRKVKIFCWSLDLTKHLKRLKYTTDVEFFINKFRIRLVCFVEILVTDWVTTVDGCRPKEGW